VATSTMRIEEVRTGLLARLRSRRGEIEGAMLTRVYGIAEQVESQDPEYAHGLRLAVGAALDYGLDALERSEDRAPPIPTVLLAQARLAARSGVSLDTVLRRYLAGYTLLGDFVIQEAEKGAKLKGGSLQRLLRAQAALFDRLLAAVGEEYAREESGRLLSSEQRRAERVKRLLAGELLDTSELAYEFGGHHLGAIALGPGAAEAVRAAAAARDCRLLLIPREEGIVWAWLGARRHFDAEEVEEFAAQNWPAGIALALGEPAQGLSGWQLTYRQAAAALPIARRSGNDVVRYGDVALLASMLRDNLLVTSLRELFLVPLERERDGGEVARETLRAYFAAERNVSSAAAVLGVSRQAVGRRLRTIEEHLRRPLSRCAMEMEAALRLDESASLLAPASLPPKVSLRPIR
jgi:PucR C-terminal helix-turn-helix domain